MAWELEKPQGSIKFDPGYQALFNQIISKIQLTNPDATINSFKTAVQAFIDDYLRLEKSEPVPTEIPANFVELQPGQAVITINPDLAHNIELLSALKPHLQPLDTTAFISVLITESLEESTPSEPIVKTEFKDRELKENQLLIELSDTEKTALEIINTNRNSRAKLRGKEFIETIADTLKKRFFIKATKYNWDGEFFTGLR